MNSEEANRLMTSAKKKLTSVGKIFKGRDNGTDFEVLCYEEDGAITAALKLWTTDHPFDPEIDEQLVASNLALLGGFKDVGVNVTECGKEMTFYATYTGDAVAEIKYGEVTLDELVRFVKTHKADFPLGIKTRISLGDFEGNTYHRKVAVGSDDGRLLLNYELNELDDEEEAR